MTFCEFVEARHDAVVFFQPAEHTLDDVALPILGSIKKPRQPRFWFALHAAQRNHRQCLRGRPRKLGMYA